MKIAFIIDQLDSPRGQYEATLATTIFKHHHQAEDDFYVLTDRESTLGFDEPFRQAVYQRDRSRAEGLCRLVKKTKFDQIYVFRLPDIHLLRSFAWFCKEVPEVNFVALSEAELHETQDLSGPCELSYSLALAALRIAFRIYVPHEGLKQYILSKFPSVEIERILLLQLFKSAKSVQSENQFSEKPVLIVALKNPDIECLDLLQNFVDQIQWNFWLFRQYKIEKFQLRILLNLTKELPYLEQWFRTHLRSNDHVDTEVHKLDEKSLSQELLKNRKSFQLQLQDNWLTNREVLFCARNKVPTIIADNLSLYSYLSEGNALDFSFKNAFDLCHKLSRILSRSELRPEINPTCYRKERHGKSERKKLAQDFSVRYIVGKLRNKINLKLTLESLILNQVPQNSISIFSTMDHGLEGDQLKNFLKKQGYGAVKVLTEIPAPSEVTREALIFLKEGGEWLKSHREIVNFVEKMQDQEIHIFARQTEGQSIAYKSSTRVICGLELEPVESAFAVINHENLRKILLPSGQPALVSAFYAGYFVTDSIEPVIKMEPGETDFYQEILDFYTDVQEAKSDGGGLVRQFMLSEFQMLRGRK
ncbi:MAG: hypothetical protein ACK5RO_10355 [Pseudobdellovibrionaceae bacterium]